MIIKNKNGISLAINSIIQVGLWNTLKIIYYKEICKKNKVFHINLKGYKHPIYLRTNTSDILVFLQVFVQKEYELNLKQNPKFIIDGGANIGLTTIYLKNSFPDATLLSIEPESGNFKILEKNCEEYSNVTPINAALWSHETTLQIENNYDSEWSFSTTPKSENKNSSGVVAKTIEGLILEHDLPKIDLVKIDIEGAEKELFKSGNLDWLNNTDELIIELHDGMAEDVTKIFFNALNDHSYQMVTSGECIHITFNK